MMTLSIRLKGFPLMLHPMSVGLMRFSRKAAAAPMNGCRHGRISGPTQRNLA